jgi:hypothetical protein
LQLLALLSFALLIGGPTSKEQESQEPSKELEALLPLKELSFALQVQRLPREKKRFNDH